MNAVESFKNGEMPLIEMILDNAPSFAGCYFFGIDEYDSGDHSETYEDCVSLKDLKQIVEAFEFVNAHGGVDVAKKYISTMDTNESSKHYERLRKLINLVEQCHA